MQAIDRQLQRYGCQMDVSFGPFSSPFPAREYGGCILFAGTRKDARIMAGVPTVWLNPAEDVDAYSVYPDDQYAASTAVALCTLAAIDKIAYVDISTTHRSGRIRRETLREESLRQHLEIVSIVRMEEVDASLLRHWCEIGVQAVLCYHGIAGIRVLSACQEAGLTAGKNIRILSLAGAGNVPVTPALSAFLIPYEELGIHAVDMLMDRIRGIHEPISAHRALPPVLQLRETF
ncbi:MAG: LacI family transcriptional regulator [Lentisphaerae bacterium]|nr:MAG: LacI family transcriptional regulator [Lentisphaerota bacterium]